MHTHRHMYTQKIFKTQNRKPEHKSERPQNKTRYTNHCKIGQNQFPQIPLSHLKQHWSYIVGQVTCPCVWFVQPVRLRWRKLILSFQIVVKWSQLVGQGWEIISSFPIQCWDLICLGAMQRFCRCHCLCEFFYVSVLLCQEGIVPSVSSIPTDFYNPSPTKTSPCLQHCDSFIYSTRILSYLKYLTINNVFFNTNF